MFGRLIVLIAMVLFGPLYIEIYLYHPAIVREHDLAAAVPLVASALGLFGGFMLLAIDNRITAAMFAVICALAIMVGVTGTAIHIALHRPDSLASLVTDPSVWLGEPPPLVPLSFAASGCLGLIALILPQRRKLDVPPIVIARILEGLAAVCALAAVVASAVPGGDTIGLLATLSSLGLGMLGFAGEFAVFGYLAWWRPKVELSQIRPEKSVR
jgi:hypothetical protein